MASGQEQQHGSVLGQQQQSAHTAPQQRGTRQQEATLRGTTLCRGTRPGLGGGADPHPPHSIRGGSEDRSCSTTGRGVFCPVSLRTRCERPQ